MDIYKFINSKDVKEYLKKTNYEFSVEEMLYFITHSKFTTLKERHKALEELKDTFPDFVLKKNSDLDETTLGVFVKKYIEIQNEYIETFFNTKINKRLNIEENARYYPSFLFSDGWGGFVPEKGYTNFNDAFNSYYEESFDKHNFTFQTKVSKIYFDRNTEIVISFLQNKSIVDIEVKSDELDDNKWVYLDYIDRLTVKTPVPFKTGDLLINISDKDIEDLFSIEKDANVIVLLDLLNKYEEDSMGILGYSLCDNGRVEYKPHVKESYLDFEIYSDELMGKLKILKAISSFLKNEIDLDVLLNAYWIIRQKYNSDCDLFNIGCVESEQEKAGLI